MDAIDQGTEQISKVHAARKVLQAAVAAAAPYTGDQEGLREALQEADDAGVPDRELNDAREKLTVMISFTFKLSEGAKDLNEAAKGKATGIHIKKLEDVITEVKQDAVATLKRTEIELWMQALTKVTATSVATDDLDKAIEEAKANGMDEAMWKPFKKQNDEAKKSQNAKKIADRKAKKPPTDPPKPPEAPVPSAKVVQLRKDLLDALQLAEAKLREAKAVFAMQSAAEGEPLKTELLNDLGERPCNELHPNLKLLEDAIDESNKAGVEAELIAECQSTFDKAKQARLTARRGSAHAALTKAAEAPSESCDVKVIGEAIKVAKEESVDEGVVAQAVAKEYESYKVQAENVLEPLAQPQALSHEAYEMIGRLTAALNEAHARGGKEDLRIKAQAKLDFWIEAHARRDKAKQALELSLKPPPCMVEQSRVKECLLEATEAKLDPKLLEAATKSLEVARLSQRVFERAKAAPGICDIPMLEDELQENGGEGLKFQQDRQADAEKLCAALKDKIAAIKETKDAQKARDALLKKQMKQRATKQKPEDPDATPLLPAWVRKEAVEETSHEMTKEEAEAVAAQQQRDLDNLAAELKEAEMALKAQVEVVTSMGTEVFVPQDVITFGQSKLKTSKLCRTMQLLMVPEILDLDTAGLAASIKACEEQFPDLQVAGMGENEINVPPEEVAKAKARLKEATKAQARRQKATSQLSVRISAPTGTATFDLLVKLVAEAKQAGVEEALIFKAELKLKKMEDLAASSLRAGPLAFVSFHCPFLRACVSSYAISLVEKAEENRKKHYERQQAATKGLLDEIGTWKVGDFDKTLLPPPKGTTVEGALRAALNEAVLAELGQEIIELARFKLAAIAKYKSDMAKGLITDEDEERRKAEAAAAAAKKKGGGAGSPAKKIKQYAYVKKT